MTSNSVSVGIISTPGAPVKWSEDGKNWNNIESGKFYADNDGVQYMTGGAYNPINNLWVICGHGNLEAKNSPLMWSDDGKNWKNSESGDFYYNNTEGTTNKVQSIYGVACNPVDNFWVACGTGNTEANNSPLMWSEDGKNWNNSITGDFHIDDSSGVQYMLEAAYNPVDNFWVACGMGNSEVSKSPLMWSDDGKNWKNSVVPGTKKNTLDIVATVAHSSVHNLWVSRCEGNDYIERKSLMWSEDGKTWNNCSGDFGELTYSATVLLAGLAYSPVDNLWVSNYHLDPGTTNLYLMSSNDGKIWKKNIGYGSSMNGVGSISYSPINKLWTIGGRGIAPHPKPGMENTLQSKDGKNWEIKYPNGKCPWSNK